MNYIQRGRPSALGQGWLGVENNISIALTRWEPIRILYLALPEDLKDELRPDFEVIDSATDYIEGASAFTAQDPEIVRYEDKAIEILPFMDAFEGQVIIAHEIVSQRPVTGPAPDEPPNGVPDDGTVPDDGRVPVGDGAAPVSRGLVNVAGGIGILALVVAGGVAAASA